MSKLLADVARHPWKDNGLSDSMKIARITKHLRSVLKILGMDLDDPSLAETPRRIAKMYVNELFAGLKPEAFPRVMTIPNDMKADEMVLVNGIRVLSVCEHHFQLIDGYATVAYIPDKKIIGLSKLNRIVKYFGRRPQVQERMTTQIADALVAVLGTKDVAVHIRAKHYCVIARGVQDTESTTNTTDLRGTFRHDQDAKSEFLASVERR